MSSTNYTVRAVDSRQNEPMKRLRAARERASDSRRRQAWRTGARLCVVLTVVLTVSTGPVIASAQGPTDATGPVSTGQAQAAGDDAPRATQSSGRSVTINSTTDPIYEGRRLVVEGWVTARSSDDGPFRVGLYIDGRRVNSTFVRPGVAGEEVVLSWTTAPGDAGTHNVTLSTGDQQDSVTIEIEDDTPPEFQVSMEQTNEPVAERFPLTVTASIVNSGTVQDTQDITLRVNRKVVDRTTVTLSEDERTTVRLSWTPKVGDAGHLDATVSSDDDSATRNVHVMQRQPPDFALTLDETTSPLPAGETLAVTTTVKNRGLEAGTQAVSLHVEGARVDRTNVSLERKETETISLAWETRGYDQGQHSITIRSANDSVSTVVQVSESVTDTDTTTTTPPPTTDSTTTTEPTTTTAATTATGPRWDVAIESTAAPVVAGDSLTVRARIENRGAAAAATNLTLAVDGKEVSRQQVTLPGGGSRVVTLGWDTETADVGDRTIVVSAGEGSASTGVSVTEPGSAAFEVRIESTAGGAGADEPLAVTATVTNTGDDRGTQAVDLIVDGVVRDTERVTLDPGRSRELTFSWEDGDGGDASVRVSSEDAAASRTVTATEESGPPLSAPMLAGVVLGGLLLVVIGVAVLRRRRQPSGRRRPEKFR